MGIAILGLLAVAAGIVLLLRRGGSSTPPVPQGQGGKGSLLSTLIATGLAGPLLLIVGLFMLGSTSFVHIGSDRVGHLNRIFAFQELPPGRIIAISGQKGPQARILGPGFHFIPLVQVLYRVEEFPVVTVPDGSYGSLTAVDGAALPEGMFIAPAISDDKVGAMLEAETFLTQGGYRGPQESVLKPGSYRLNHYLFRVVVNNNTRATIIPAGSVGVVKSNVTKPGAVCVEEKVKAAAQSGRTLEGALSVPLVPKGCVGIWKEPLLPGAYYLNRQAYEVTLVDTRVRTEVYKGGFNKRMIDLTLDQQGNIAQKERAEVQQIPKDAADGAVFVKMEGWDVPLELRVLAQIVPENAAVVVGSVGGLEEVEKRILTPAVRSIARNVAGGQVRVPVRKADGTIADPPVYEVRPTRALDLIDNRESLEQMMLEQLRHEGHKAGIEVKEIRIGEPAIPPELLISRIRVQLADQLAKAYERESAAQAKRTETEKSKATADEQPRLVAAQIAVQVASQREAERAALGRAERQYLEELARGQSAQAGVLGQDRVAALQALEKVLSTLEKKPELVKLATRLVPQTVVSSGDGGGLAGAAAILGSLMRGSDGAAAAAKPPAARN